MKITRFVLVIILNLTIVAFEIIFGLRANSMGLVADALHNLSDVAAVIIALIAQVYGEKKASERMTFGYVRAEMMAGFINSLLLVAAMGYVIYESVVKLVHKEQVEGQTMMIVAGIALVANLISVFLLRGTSIGHAHHDPEGHHHEQEHGEDLNIKAAVLHLFSDAAISLAVIVGGLVILFSRWYFVDPVLTFVFSAYILFHAFAILRKTFQSLMDRNNKDITHITERICAIEEVKSVHGVHMTIPSSRHVFFSAHIVLKQDMPMSEVEHLLERIRQLLREEGVTHSVLQPETGKYHQDDILCNCH